MTSYGIISVRTASSRLPEKCLFNFGDNFGEVNVLQHVIRRAKHFGFTPVVATTTLREDDIVAEIAQREEALCFRGSAEDKLQRWLDACNQFGIHKFVTLDGDDLFFAPDLAYRGLELLDIADIVYPSSHIYVGSFSFALTRDIVERACELKDSGETEMMWHFIEKVPDVKQTKMDYKGTPVNFRLTLDYPEDYWMLDTVRRILGCLAERKEIEDLFWNNFNLHEVNWFRNADMKRGHEVGGSGLF